MTTKTSPKSPRYTTWGTQQLQLAPLRAVMQAQGPALYNVLVLVARGHYREAQTYMDNHPEMDFSAERERLATAMRETEEAV